MKQSGEEKMKKYTKLMIAIYAFAIVVVLLFVALYGKKTIYFLIGLWHGVRAPIVLVLNIFGNQVKFYNNLNSSNLYNFGFIIGIINWSSPKTIRVIRKKR